MKPLSSNLLSAAAIPPLTVGAAFGRRGRRCPAVAHGGSVSASLRLPSGARLGVASHNSLRSLRSLRSNRCDESEYEAREVARGPQGCTPQRPTNRPRRAAPAAKTNSAACVGRAPPCLGKGTGGRLAARLCAAEKHRARGRARTRALRALTRRICPSAANAVSVASYATRPRDRASQGTLAQRGPATKHCQPPARAFACADEREQCELRRLQTHRDVWRSR